MRRQFLDSEHGSNLQVVLPEQSGWRLMRQWKVRLDGYLLRQDARDPYEAYIQAYESWTERYPQAKPISKAQVEGVGYFACPPT